LQSYTAPSSYTQRPSHATASQQPSYPTASQQPSYATASQQPSAPTVTQAPSTTQEASPTQQPSYLPLVSGSPRPYPSPPPPPVSGYAKLSDQEWTWIFCAIIVTFFVLASYTHSLYKINQNLRQEVLSLQSRTTANPVYRNQHISVRNILPLN
jgi:hypothetical protein